MNETKMLKRKPLKGKVSTRIPQEVAHEIRVKAEEEDRTVAHVVRRTLIQHFGQKNG